MAKMAAVSWTARKIGGIVNIACYPQNGQNADIIPDLYYLKLALSLAGHNEFLLGVTSYQPNSFPAPPSNGPWFINNAQAQMVQNLYETSRAGNACGWNFPEGFLVADGVLPSDVDFSNAIPELWDLNTDSSDYLASIFSPKITPLNFNFIVPPIGNAIQITTPVIINALTIPVIRNVNLGVVTANYSIAFTGNMLV